MPTTLEATQYLQENGVIFAPGKAANAGGVATSALEMSQNSERLSWTFEEVDAKLKNIMVNICHNIDDAAKRYGIEGNYVANIAGFEKVVDAMKKDVDFPRNQCYTNEVGWRNDKIYGIIAQLGEHLPYKQRVIGSSPIGPI